MSPVWGNFALGSPLMLMGTVCLNFHEALSKRNPSGLNELQIRLTNAERERATFRKARITYKRLENVSSILRITLFHAEEIPLTLMGIPSLIHNACISVFVVVLLEGCKVA